MEMKDVKKYLAMLSTGFLIMSCSDNIEDVITTDTETEKYPVEYVYKISSLNIITQDGKPVISKEKEDYINCDVSLLSDYDGWNYSGTARIRGRGNSTWHWYPKKPYRIKLDKKSEILGLDSAKDWVLLANYRDPTHAMNTFTFVAGNYAGLPYTNHSRYVELTLNGAYLGVYLLTEQVQQGKSRVNIDKEEGRLLALDLDDGPGLSPSATDNFWSSGYSLPICIKHPDDVTSGQLSSIKDEFAELESAIKRGTYPLIRSLLDVESFIKYMIIQELVYNVELNAPRSMFIYRDKGGLWTMGPLWDFDAGFDFDWATMYTGHDYFSSYKELAMGTDPAKSGDRGAINPFFTDLFKHKEFVEQYKAQWRLMKDDVVGAWWEETNKYLDGCSAALDRDNVRWPIGKNRESEIRKMKNWLQLRASYLNSIIENYPDGTK